MTNLTTITLLKKFAPAIKNGYPLLTKDMVIGKLPAIEGTLLRIVDEQNRFLATAYYGLQNKGIGWVLSRNEAADINQAFFTNTLQKAFDLRQDFFDDKTTTAFRVFNGEGDGIGGLTIEYFDGYYVVNWYSEGIYSFKQEIYHALEQLTSFKAVYEKLRFDGKGQYIEKDDFVMGTPGEFPIIILENNMRYAVNLNDGAMTGIFLDQREVRKAIRDRYANNSNMLNTFSYTGAFSVAAALGGASKTTSVDVAKRSLAKTIEQFSVNAIDYEAQAIQVMDVFSYFNYAKRHNLTFDLVVLDPPSFARTKKVTFSSAKDYPKLLAEAIDITNKDGVIVASTNNASFGMKKFKQLIDQAFKKTATRYTILEEHSLPSDFRTPRNFPEFDYLKVVFIKKK